MCALDYGACLREMVRPGDDARLFRTADELAALVDELLGAFPTATPGLDRLRAGALAAAAGPRWEDEWRAAAAPLLLGMRDGATSGGRCASPSCIPSSALGGAERLMVDAALSLQARGHRVTIFTSPSTIRCAASPPTRDGRLSRACAGGGLPLQSAGVCARRSPSPA